MTASLPKFLQEHSDKQLVWWPELGLGWYPVEDQPYDRAYWEKYLVMDVSPTGDALNEARCNLVRKYYTGNDLVDVGIGGGRFVREIGGFGYDINPDAVEWLNREGRWRNPYVCTVEALTFWDSLEHIHDPVSLLSHAKDYVFVSAPIYENADHILRSKHFRKDEHCHYWTKDGLIRLMSGWGFDCLEYNEMEQACGREDIGTFVFRKTP